MKQVVLSADGDRKVYAVPDQVADHLEDYCLWFCTRWLWESPHAAPYRVGGVLRYDEADFIRYLNRWVFPHQPSSLVENLGWVGYDEALPPPYRDCPQFNF